jgi:hypothetical protein
MEEAVVKGVLRAGGEKTPANKRLRQRRNTAFISRQHWSHRGSVPFEPVNNTSVSPVGSGALVQMRIEHSDRVIGYGAALLAAISFAILWVPNLHHASRGVTGATYLAVGLVLAAFLALATAIGRRALVVMASLFITVGPWGPERLFQLLFLFLTVFLVVRLVMRLRAAKSEATNIQAVSAVPPPVPLVRKGSARPVQAARAKAGSSSGRVESAHPATAGGSRPARPAERGAAGRRRSRTSTRRAALVTQT